MVKNPIDVLVTGVHNTANKLARSPAGVSFTRLATRAPKLPQRKIPTPFGSIKPPEIGLPEIRAFELEPRKLDALKAAVISDVIQVVGIVPVLGDIIADMVEDTYAEKIYESLTPEEDRRYIKYDKFGPTTIAVARAFMEVRNV